MIVPEKLQCDECNVPREPTVVWIGTRGVDANGDGRMGLLVSWSADDKLLRECEHHFCSQRCLGLWWSLDGKPEGPDIEPKNWGAAE
jgi:hypothetical protein